MKDKSTNAIVGIGWYRPEQYYKLIEVADDADKLEETYGAWLVSAEEALRNAELAGLPTQKVDVDVDLLLGWCAEHGLVVNGNARAQYVAEQLRLQEQ